MKPDPPNKPDPSKPKKFKLPSDAKKIKGPSDIIYVEHQPQATTPTSLSDDAVAYAKSYIKPNTFESSPRFSKRPNGDVAASVFKAKSQGYLQTFLHHDAANTLPTYIYSSHAHFDWWQFPIDIKSSYPQFYVNSQDNINILKANAKMMDTINKSLILVAKAYGWDLVNERMYSKEKRTEFGGARYDDDLGTNRHIRLAKMTRCCWLFGLDKQMKSLQKFARELIDQKHVKQKVFMHGDDQVRTGYFYYSRGKSQDYLLTFEPRAGAGN